MITRKRIQHVLAVYDKRKGLLRRYVSGDPLAISALKQMIAGSAAQEFYGLEVLKCFFKHMPKREHESYQVYLALVKPLFGKHIKDVTQILLICQTMGCLDDYYDFVIKYSDDNSPLLTYPHFFYYFFKKRFDVPQLEQCIIHLCHFENFLKRNNILDNHIHGELYFFADKLERLQETSYWSEQLLSAISSMKLPLIVVSDFILALNKLTAHFKETSIEHVQLLLDLPYPTYPYQYNMQHYRGYWVYPTWTVDAIIHVCQEQNIQDWTDFCNEYPNIISAIQDLHAKTARQRLFTSNNLVKFLSNPQLLVNKYWFDEIQAEGIQITQGVLDILFELQVTEDIQQFEANKLDYLCQQLPSVIFKHAIAEYIASVDMSMVSGQSVVYLLDDVWEEVATSVERKERRNGTLARPGSVRDLLFNSQAHQQYLFDCLVQHPDYKSGTKATINERPSTNRYTQFQPPPAQLLPRSLPQDTNSCTIS